MIEEKKKRDKSGPLALDDLKKNYEPLKKKYGLPEFLELNEIFSIEKIDGTETDFLMREIRRVVSETYSNYLTIIENLLNPSNAPMFVFSIVKSISQDEKKKLSEIYMALSKEWVPLVQLDLKYSEEAEAEFVKHSFHSWKKMSLELYEITDKISKSMESNIEGKKAGYLG